MNICEAISKLKKSPKGSYISTGGSLKYYIQGDEVWCEPPGLMSTRISGYGVAFYTRNDFRIENPKKDETERISKVKAQIHELLSQL